MSGPTILLTRPGRASEALAQELSQKGFVPFIEPMLTVKNLPVDLPDLSAYQALVFTSANGVRAFCPLSSRRDLPVYVVGNRTKEEASVSGFQDVRCGGGNVKALADLLKKDNPGTILYVRGQHVARPLLPLLPEMEIEEVCVYLSEKSKKITESLWKKLASGEVDAVLFFSARTACTFVDILLEAGKGDLAGGIKALCLSDEVLKSLSVLSWEKTYVCNMPERGEMIALLGRVYGEKEENE